MINILNALVTEASRQPNDDIARQLARQGHMKPARNIVTNGNYSYRNVIAALVAKIWRRPQIDIVACSKPWNNAGT